jgi:predicted RNase H-like HicB family nuclease
MASYIALLRKESRSDFGVSFPDFPGCIIAGRTLEEARLLAKEALDAHVALMMEDGDPVPGPSTLDEIVADRAHRDALPFLVDLTPPEEPALRINITVPKRDLATIDAAAEQANQSRSAFLVKAALAAAGGAAVAEQKQPAYRVARRPVRKKR